MQKSTLMPMCLASQPGLVPFRRWSVLSFCVPCATVQYENFVEVFGKKAKLVGHYPVDVPSDYSPCEGYNPIKAALKYIM